MINVKHRFFLIFTCLSFGVLCQLLAQNVVETKKRYYVSEDKKLYWQGDLPVYLFISDNPEGEDPTRLKSQKTEAFADPMYLDAEGLNYMRSRYAVDPETRQQVVPNIEVLYEIYKDSQAPITAVKFENASIYTTSDDTFYGPGLQVRSSATDVNAGVEHVFLSVNEKPYSLHETIFEPTMNGAYTLKFYATDNVGNTEQEKTYQFTFDTEPPLSTLKTIGDGVENIHSARTRIELSSDDLHAGVKSIYYSIDGGSRRRYTSAISLAGLKDGEHKIVYYGQDHVLNQEVEKSYSFYLDTEPPLVQAQILGDEYENSEKVFVSTRSKVQLTASDNKSGVQKIIYSIDGGEEQVYEGPFNLLEESGISSIKFYATDNVNNNVAGDINEKSFSSSFNIDNSGPDLNFSYLGPNYKLRDTVFITRETKISLLADDGTSGVNDIGYTVNSGALTPFSEPASFEEEGLYTIEFTSSDKVKNTNTESFFFIVDNTGPVIQQVMSMQPIGTINLDDQPLPIPVFSKGAKLYLAATDERIDTQKISFQIDGGEALPYSRPYKFKTPGMVTYQVKAVDELGNESVNEPVTIFIK